MTKTDNYVEDPRFVESRLRDSTPTPPALSLVEEFDPEALSRPVPILAAPSISGNSDRAYADNSESATTSSRQKKYDRKSLGNESVASSLTPGALQRITSHLNRVVLTYRTNEWAKHISESDAPTYDEPQALPEEAKEETPAHVLSQAIAEDEPAQTPANPPAEPLPLERELPVADASAIGRAPSAASKASKTHKYRTSFDSTTQPDTFLVRQLSQMSARNASAGDIFRDEFDVSAATVSRDNRPAKQFDTSARSTTCEFPNNGA